VYTKACRCKTQHCHSNIPSQLRPRLPRRLFNARFEIPTVVLMRACYAVSTGIVTDVSVQRSVSAWTTWPWRRRHHAPQSKTQNQDDVNTIQKLKLKLSMCTPWRDVRVETWLRS
jgi:hypothetical protein